MRCLVIIVAGLLLTAPATAQTTQVLLKADSTAVSKKIDNFCSRFGAKIDRRVPGLQAAIVSVPNRKLDRLIASANSASGISAIETLGGSDYRQLFKFVPSDDRNPMTLFQAPLNAMSTAIAKLRARASSASLYLVEIRPAGISIDLLKGALTIADGFQQPKSIKLNLAPGVSVDATQTRMDQQPGGGFVWYGKIGNPNDRASRKSGVASLVVNGDRISGTATVSGDVYTIHPLGDGLHAIVKTNPGAYPLDHPPGAKPPSNAPPVPQRGRAQDQAPSTIRALVLYTPAVRQAVLNPENVAATAVANTNAASLMSRVAMNLMLAKTAELNYAEKDFVSDLAMLHSSPIVAKLRDSAQAQVVFLLTTISPGCGMSDAILATKDSAFAVVNYDCAMGNFSLAHEFGHLLGLRHERTSDPAVTPFKNGHGYVYRNAWRTIMATKDSCGECPRVPIWSNPALKFNGVPSGTIDYENEAGVINTTAPILAGSGASGVVSQSGSAERADPERKASRPSTEIHRR